MAATSPRITSSRSRLTCTWRWCSQSRASRAARGKVERIFETVNQLFLCHQPGYTPAGSTPAKPVLTLPELDARLRTFLVETYHQQPHSETGVPPQARWEANGFLPRLPDSLEQLDLLLLTVAKPRRVHQDGIHFQGFRYQVI